MPWKERYTISDEKSLADDEVRWLGGARCCVSITVDLSLAAVPEGVRATDLRTPPALFGMGQGLAVVLGMLKRYELKATFAVPAVTAHIYPDKIRAIAGEAHEIAAHGFKHETSVRSSGQTRASGLPARPTFFPRSLAGVPLAGSR
jgi:peptidoglycan-N-acetylglucosamine deacetylase